jgi:hypothetical protein
MIPLIALAAKLLPLASVVPEVMRAFGSTKSAEAADAVLTVAKRVAETDDAESAVDRIITDPGLQLQFQQMMSAERLQFAAMELQDRQHAHEQQQITIRTGDTTEDVYVRHTRPLMARQSWYATMVYIIGFELAQALERGTGASWEMAMVLLAPAAAYLGFRTGDKFAAQWGKGRGSKSAQVRG